MRKLVQHLVLLTLTLAAMAADPAPPPPKTVAPDTVIRFLSDSITWYRQAITQTAAEPADEIYVAASRQVADDYLRSAFDYARAQATLIDAQQPSSTDGTQTTTSTTLQQSLDSIGTQIDGYQKQIDDIEAKVPRAKPKDRASLLAQRDEIKSAIALALARRDALSSIVTYMRSSAARGNVKATLAARIDDLERSVPELQSSAATKAGGLPDTTSSAATPKPSADVTQRSSSIALLPSISTLIQLHRNSAAVKQQLRNTTALRDTITGMISPLRESLTSLTQRGNVLVQTASTDPAILAATKQQIDDITNQYKQVSGVLVPLGKDAILLDNYKGNLSTWREQLDSSEDRELQSVGLRLGLLIGVILLLLLLSETWRRGAFRYIHDVRRRNQILLVRRVVVTFVVVVVIIFTVVAEAGALATYAGLVTAGLAVALQNVILSVIAYFFLIGRFGVHVGDRVTISGITGNVLEIGLLRLHLMELAGEETDLHPTGRVVVFANSVILQPTSHFFKQAPSSNFVWHEVKVTCQPGSKYPEVYRRLEEVVTSVYATEKNAGPLGEVPKPILRLLITEGGPRIVIRYPVNARHSGDIDQRVSRAVLEIISGERGVQITSDPLRDQEAS